MKPQIEMIPNAPLRYLRMIAAKDSAYVGLTIFLMCSGAVCANLIPYAVKQIVDSTSRYWKGGADTQTTWTWGITAFALFIGGEALLRCGGFAGSRSMARLKAESYRFFLRTLTSVNRSSEPGAIIEHTVVISENTQAIFEKFYWFSIPVLVKLIVLFGLAVAVHPILGGVCGAWMCLHIVLAVFFARIKHQFTLHLEQASAALKGGLVNFCRVLMHNSKTNENLAPEISRLDNLVEERETQQKLDLWVHEGILIFYNVLHATFMVLLTMTLMFFWQNRQLTEGDLAMFIAVIWLIQNGLTDYTTMFIAYAKHLGELEEGLNYFRTQST